MAGLDLGGVPAIISGSERIHAATIRRFNERFAAFNLPDTAMRPSYGLAEATVYVTSSDPGRPATTVRFDYEKLSAGHAKRCEEREGGSELVELRRTAVDHRADRRSGDRRGEPGGQDRRDLGARRQGRDGGYWRNPQQTERTFAGRDASIRPRAPRRAPWLRTGDLGVMSDGELFIIGRIKDLLIVDGRNHYPDDIEATIQEITGGRVAAISIPDDDQRAAGGDRRAEEARSTPMSDALQAACTSSVKSPRRSSKSHSVRVADLVLVAPGSTPDHHQREDAARRPVWSCTAGRVQPFGRHYMTSAFDEDAVRHWLVDYLVTNIGCSPDADRSRCTR